MNHLHFKLNGVSIILIANEHRMSENGKKREEETLISVHVMALTFAIEYRQLIDRVV
jgi:hypothetical protein